MCRKHCNSKILLCQNKSWLDKGIKTKHAKYFLQHINVTLKLTDGLLSSRNGVSILCGTCLLPFCFFLAKILLIYFNIIPEIFCEWIKKQIIKCMEKIKHQISLLKSFWKCAIWFYCPCPHTHLCVCMCVCLSMCVEPMDVDRSCPSLDHHTSLVRVLRGHSSEVFTCAWSPTADILVSG